MCLGLAQHNQRVRFVTARDIYTPIYIEHCGKDGLNNQASYDPKLNQVILCNGFLLSLINFGTIYGIDFFVGHELTHSIDPFTDPTAYGGTKFSGPPRAPLYERYNAF